MLIISPSLLNSRLYLIYRLSFIWTSTRDNILRKPRANHRYGLEFKIKHHTIHLLLYILLAGDIATNPGPAMSVKCLGLNARSLTSLVKDKTESNLERFQNFVYSEDLDIVCVNETWLSNNVYNAEIQHSGYTIFRLKIVKAEVEVSCWGLSLKHSNLCVKLTIIMTWKFPWLN